MRISVEKTTDENTLRFNVDFVFKVCGEYVKQNEKENPITTELLQIEGVKKIVVSETSILITKNEEEKEWSFIKPQIISAILTFDFAKHRKVSQVKYQPETETEKKIQEVIEKRIRKAIQSDGGDIEFLGITQDGLAKIKLKGACVGCPSLDTTLKEGVERTIKHFVPEVKGVKNVT